MTASNSALDITSNNIANANTIGFKDSQAEFADVYASGAVNLNSSTAGEGVRLVTAAQQFTQGNISTTSAGALDLAISGNGFFTLNSANGNVYTRNGQFSEDANGNVVSRHRPVPAGLSAARQRRLQHRRAVEPESQHRAERAGGDHDRQRDLESAVECDGADAGAVRSRRIPATYNQSTSTTVYDSLGNSYPATFYFSPDRDARPVERQHDGRTARGRAAPRP